MSEWRDIESAPKDEAIVLAYFGPESAVNGYATVGHFFQWEKMPKPLAAHWPFTLEPTHWMPLPAPPEGAAGEKMK